LMAGEYLPRQVGARAIESATAPQGRDWMFWPLTLALGIALARGVQFTWQRWRAASSAPIPAFGWYLVGIGTLSAVAYVMTRSVDSGLVDRYMLLTLYAPVGIAAVFMSLEPQRWLRTAFLGLLVVWMGVSAVDHAKLFARYWGGKEPDEVQALADELVARGIHVAGAGYWRAYRVSFLSREKVKVAASDVGRISEYERLARAEGRNLIVIREEPCTTDLAPIGRWNLCRD